MSKNTRTRILLTAVAALLLVTMAVGGTLAWLTATSGPVENTFKPSDIDVLINESPYTATTNTIDTTAAKVTANTGYQFVPGVNLPKDPEVTVDNDVDCYVFLKVTGTNWPSYAKYEIDSTWTQLKGYTDVWYKEVAADADVKSFNVLVGDQVTVDQTVTDMSESYEGGTAKNVKLTFNAYACQKAPANDPVTAWTTYLGQPAASNP